MTELLDENCCRRYCRTPVWTLLLESESIYAVSSWTRLITLLLDGVAGRCYELLRTLLSDAVSGAVIGNGVVRRCWSIYSVLSWTRLITLLLDGVAGRCYELLRTLLSDAGSDAGSDAENGVVGRCWSIYAVSIQTGCWSIYVVLIWTRLTVVAVLVIRMLRRLCCSCV